MKRLKDDRVSWIAVSVPVTAVFRCPHCLEQVEVPFKECSFYDDNWAEGGWCICPECNENVELGDWEYD